MPFKEETDATSQEYKIERNRVGNKLFKFFDTDWFQYKYSCIKSIFLFPLNKNQNVSSAITVYLEHGLL